MGGKALKNLGVQRLRADEYPSRLVRFKTLMSQVNDALGQSAVQYLFPTELRGKESYGDLDVIMYDPSGNREDAFLKIMEVFKSQGFFRQKNSICWSFEWEGLQVDINWVTDADQLTWQKLWYSHSELSAYVGYVFRYYGFVLDHFGLMYKCRVRLGGGTFVKDVLVHADYAKALKLMGYDYNPCSSFTFDEIFDLACQTPYLPATLQTTHPRPTITRFLDNTQNYVSKNKYPKAFGLWLLFKTSPAKLFEVLGTYVSLVTNYYASKVRRWYRLNVKKVKHGKPH